MVFVVCDIDLLLACNIHNGCQFHIDFCIHLELRIMLILLKVGHHNAYNFEGIR